MKPTIKSFKTKFEALPYLTDKKSWYGNREGQIVLDSKGQSQWAKCFTQFCWYADNILKTFPEAEISIEGEILSFDYYSGEARLFVERCHIDVLLPAIEDICTKYGKQVINKNVIFKKVA